MITPTPFPTAILDSGISYGDALIFNVTICFWIILAVSLILQLVYWFLIKRRS